MYIIFPSAIVPSDSPQNVQATTLSSTTIQVTWEAVPAIAQNGIIISYEVLYVPLITFNGTLQSMFLNSSNGQELSEILIELEEFVEYNISLRAYTSAGGGPFSEAVANRTFEDGKAFILYSLLILIVSLLIISPSEPATPPQNVQAATVSSTEITVNWEEVPMIDQNGIIINYEVQFEPLQFTGELETETIITTNLTASITGLEEYVQYNISVRAYTSVGPGPYSDPVTERTFEDGITFFSFLSRPLMIMYFPACTVHFHAVSTTHRTSHSSSECADYCSQLNSDHGYLGGSP